MAHRTDSSTRALRAALQVEPLLESALRRSRRADFSNRSFVRSLEHLLAACNEEADLNVFGLWALRFDVLRCLRNLLHFDALEERSPTLLSAPVAAPVFITGMPRSGTTFLHRLILQDSHTNAPRLFELVDPARRHSTSISPALRKAAVRLQLTLFRLVVPELHTLHPVAVDAPEECTDIIAQVFHSWRFESTYRISSYSAWLHSSGFLDAYRFHRRFLQHLQPQRPGRRWVLKSPDHVFALDDLKAVYPDARLIVVHRDPVRVLASVAKLTEVLRRPFTRQLDPMRIGREVTASWIDGTRRISALPFDESSVLHLHFQEIISQPLRTVEAVYRHCGLILTEDAERRMWFWLNKYSTASRHPRRYDLEHFGLDAHHLRDAFAAYTEKFRIEIESDRTDQRRVCTSATSIARAGS